MALFKQLRGSRASLDTQPLHDGYAYFCTDDGSFHIDYVDDSGILQRKQLNAKDAETLMGKSLDEIKEEIVSMGSGVTEEFLESLDYRVDFVKDALVGGSSVPWATEDQAAACTTIGALPKPADNPIGSALLQCTYSPLNNSVTYGYVTVGTSVSGIAAYQSNSTDMSVLYGANCTLYVDTPTGSRHAANKQYVDNAVDSLNERIDNLGSKLSVSVIDAVLTLEQTGDTYKVAVNNNILTLL